MPNRRHLTAVGEIDSSKTKKKLAHGSTPPPSDRLQAAGIRTCDAYASIRRKAQRLMEEMDEVTSPNGVPTTELHEEDSMVVAVREARDVVAKS